MRLIQNFWGVFFLFAPAIYLGINEDWKVGGLAFCATLFLSWVLGLLFLRLAVDKASLEVLTLWGWVKPLFIAFAVIQFFSS